MANGLATATPAPRSRKALRNRLELFAGVEQRMRSTAGTYLFREDDPADGVFLVHSGEVALVASSPDGAERVLRTARIGSMLGLSAVVARRNHEVAARVLHAANIGFIPAEELHRALEADPQGWLPVLESLSRDLDSCYDVLRAATLAAAAAR
jgi:CRP-like cAMP-binding protein